MTHQQLDYVFVDEISMVPEMFYKFFVVLKRMRPQLKFIFAGDFCQLLPVKDRIGTFDFKKSCVLHELCDGNRLQLSKCRRADDTLFNLCNPETIGNVDVTQFKNCFTDQHISYTNVKRKEINNIMMDKFVKQKKKAPLQLKALTFDGNFQDVKLLSGMPIISRVNNKELDIVNNQTFVIKQIEHKTNTIVCEDEDVILRIDFDDFQKLFYVAFCITIYTIKRKYIR